MARAYVLIVNESGTENYVISNLRNISSIRNLYGTFGSFDLLITLESNNEEEIQNYICFKINFEQLRNVYIQKLHSFFHRSLYR